ncbi:MAG: hypothetical protein ACRDSR_07175 [Pseudonocardiaceae bacterium]
MFRGEKGAMLRRGYFGRSTKWPVVVAAGLPAGFHFHDLRHTGNQLAASSGATTRELMHRMGHGSMRKERDGDGGAVGHWFRWLVAR